MKVYLISLLFTLATHAEFRTWTNDKGQTIEAEYLRMKGEEHVSLRLKRNLSVTQVPLSSLSEEDQSYLKELAASAAAEELLASYPSANGKFTEDAEEAAQAQKATQRPLFMVFTGSDWCPPCKALESNILSSSAFKKFAEKKLILLKLDYPNGKQSRAIASQNAELKSQYGISSFPTVIIQGHDGKEIARKSGFSSSSPKEYIEQLEKKL